GTATHIAQTRCDVPVPSPQIPIVYDDDELPRYQPKRVHGEQYSQPFLTAQVVNQTQREHPVKPEQDRGHLAHLKAVYSQLCCFANLDKEEEQRVLSLRHLA